MLMIHRKTPFANGPTDSPEEILKRINESKYQIDSGNWSSVSGDTKVWSLDNNLTLCWYQRLTLLNYRIF